MEQNRNIVHVIDSDPRNRAAFARAVFDIGHHAEVYDNIAELAGHMPAEGIVLARDDHAAGGVEELIAGIRDAGGWLPVIALAQEAPRARVVAAMRAGAFDYLEQPLDPAALDAAICQVARKAKGQSAYRRRAQAARLQIALLSNREREVLDLLAQGCSNKMIGRDLDISPRTVEIHRGNMMDKLGARHAAEAVRLRLEASMGEWLH